jgi:phosphatidylserine decarboxylase
MGLTVYTFPLFCYTLTMRLPFTKYGLPQLAVYPLLVLAVMVVLFMVFKPALLLIPVEIILFLVFIWMLSFFRDPSRTIAYDEKVLLSPADGTITDISIVDDSELGVKALRIGMFLSIFNVHINRAPCAVRVEKVNYKKGQFKNAMSPESGRINESNSIHLVRLSEPGDTLLVRQVSGAIARHIVCEAKVAAEYRQGEPFGMIKFGSRTELYISVGEDGKLENGALTNRRFEINVKIGDRVRAGLTPLARYLP